MTLMPVLRYATVVRMRATGALSASTPPLLPSCYFGSRPDARMLLVHINGSCTNPGTEDSAAGGKVIALLTRPEGAPIMIDQFVCPLMDVDTASDAKLAAALVAVSRLGEY